DGQRELAVQPGDGIRDEDLPSQGTDRQVDPRERADLGAPRARGVHDGVAGDVAVARADGGHTIAFARDAGHGLLLAEARALFLRARDVPAQKTAGIAVAVAHAEGREAEIVDVELREDRA